VGQEIVYCFKCQRRILGTEFAEGKAFQVKNHVSCSACAADLLQKLPANEREQLLSKMFKATQERKPAPPPPDARPKPRQGSSVRIAAVRPPRKSPALALAAGAGFVAVALVALLLLLGGRETPPPAPAPVVVRPAPKPAAAPPAHEAAKEAVRRAKDFAAMYPRNLAARWTPGSGRWSGATARPTPRRRTRG